jgi:hypothetical protein
MTMLATPSLFFASVRTPKLGYGLLTSPVVEGMNALLAAMGGADWDIAWTAYGLATAYRETAATMKPIREYGSDAYLSKYDSGSLARALGNTEPGDGVKFCGRGYVQVTGRRNYQKAQDELGVPFVASPDLALDPANAALIMTRGMQEGWFTGRMLNGYLFENQETAENFTAARAIINGSDHAAEIANDALIFQSALTNGGWA